MDEVSLSTVSTVRVFTREECSKLFRDNLRSAPYPFQMENISTGERVTVADHLDLGQILDSFFGRVPNRDPKPTEVVITFSD